MLTGRLRSRSSQVIRMLFLSLSVALIAACLVPIGMTQPVAAWSTDPTVNTPVCTVGRYQVSPVMVSDGSGGAIVAWQDGRKETYDWDIYVQRLDPEGLSLWTGNGVPVCNGAENQWYPAMVSDGSGGAIIAWKDDRGSSSAIYAQKVTSGGALQWAGDGVAVCTSANLEAGACAVSDGNHGVIVVWLDWCVSDSSYCYDGTIYAQRLGSDGRPQWAAGGVAVAAVTSGDDYTRPEIAVAADGAGGAIVTWQNYADAQWDVRAQRIDPAGALQWGDNGITVAGTPHKDWCPEIASDGSGGAIIAWSDYPDDGASGIRTQRVNAAGVAQWAEGGALVFTQASSEDIQGLVLAGDGSHGAIMAWIGAPGGGADIYAQRVDSSGTVRWASNGKAICTEMHTQMHPVAVNDGFGGAVIAWHDGRSENPVYEINDIYAQRVDAGGAALWTNNGVAVCRSAQIRTAAAVVADGTGGAILAWNDQRTAGYQNEHLYAQRVNAQGQLGSGTVPPSGPAVPALVSPANGAITGDHTPYLDWSKVTASTTVHYRLQVDNNADFSSPAVSKTSVSYSYYTVTTSLSHGTYYWRVRSVDAKGNMSAWTAPWSFTVGTVAPAVPALVAPANGAVITDHTPYLDWSKVTASSTVHYQLQVDNNADFSSPAVSKTWVSYSYYTVTTSLSHGTYYWRVRSVDASGNKSAWTTARSFRVA